LRTRRGGVIAARATKNAAFRGVFRYGATQKAGPSHPAYPNQVMDAPCPAAENSCEPETHVSASLSASCRSGRFTFSRGGCMSFIELFQSFIDRSRSAALVLAVSAPLALAGCGGGDDDKDEGGSGGNGDAVNMVGTWTVTETITDTCGGGSYTETFTFTITEESAGLVLEDEMEDTVVLQVNGNTATWSVNETTE